MADAPETLVFLAARDSLLGISPSDGYSARPRVEIGAGERPPDPMTGPVLLIHDAHGSVSMRIVHQPPMWEHAVRFAVECWAHGKGEDGRIRELTNLTSDVRRRFRVDRRLGGLLTSDLMEADPAETDQEQYKHLSLGSARLDYVAHVTTQEEE